MKKIMAENDQKEKFRLILVEKIADSRKPCEKS